MKRFIFIMIAPLIAIALAPCGAQLFAQRGQGAGLGRVQVGAGAGARVSAPDIRVRSDAGVRGGVATSERGRESSVARAEAMERRTPREVLAENTHLAARLQTMLPPGESTLQAASGFKNMGQFVAAVHVSNNLKIPFDRLKAEMTGSQKLSLGEAIHQFNGSVNAKAEAKKATKQARADLEGDAGMR